jgi:hypothetical protein
LRKSLRVEVEPKCTYVLETAFSLPDGCSFVKTIAFSVHFPEVLMYLGKTQYVIRIQTLLVQMLVATRAKHSAGALK